MHTVRGISDSIITDGICNEASKVDTNREADSVAVQCDHNLDFTQPLSTTTSQEEKNGAALG